MNCGKCIGLSAAAIAVAGQGFAGSNVPSNQVDARISALEQEIASLKAEAGSNWLNDERAEEIRALVSEVMGDASNRTSLLAGGGHAGWDNGFYLSNDDGSFTLHVHGLAQFRAMYNSRDGRDTDSGPSLDSSIFGFENSRTRLDFSGNLFGNDFTYRIQGDFWSDGGAFTLLDAWGRYQLNDNSGVGWGQMKAPFLREEMMEEKYIQTVDRSYVHALTTAGYTQGVWLDYNNNENFRAWFAFTDGATVSTTGVNTDGSNVPALAAGGNEFALTARGEFLVAGSQGFDQFNDFASWSDDEYGTTIGGAVHWQKSEFGTAAMETEVLGWTFDSQTELGGANIFASVTGLHADPNGAGTPTLDQLGIVVQGGVFLQPDEFEIFGRWEYYDFDGAFGSSVDDEVNLFTIGANWYWEGHDKKWTTDVVFAGDTIPASASNLGLLVDDTDQDGQFVVRSQVQFAF